MQCRTDGCPPVVVPNDIGVMVSAMVVVIVVVMPVRIVVFMI